MTDVKHCTSCRLEVLPGMQLCPRGAHSEDTVACPEELRADNLCNALRQSWESCSLLLQVMGALSFRSHLLCQGRRKQDGAGLASRNLVLTHPSCCPH